MTDRQQSSNTLVQRTKETAVEIAPVLASIFNQSLSTGVVPEDWRQANIFALHKKGSKELPENYRPISLTSICSKMLEHIVFSNVSHFLESHNILTPRQHGFRRGHFVRITADRPTGS